MSCAEGVPPLSATQKPLKISCPHWMVVEPELPTVASVVVVAGLQYVAAPFTDTVTTNTPINVTHDTRFKLPAFLSALPARVSVEHETQRNPNILQLD